MWVTQHCISRMKWEKNPINQTQKRLLCWHNKKNKTLCERPHHNWVLDIFDTSNLLKSFWNVFPCKDVSFHSVREYTLSLIYTALRVVHLFCLFLGLSFQKKTSCHKFHTIHGYKRSLVIGHNLPHETRFRFFTNPYLYRWSKILGHFFNYKSTVI